MHNEIVKSAIYGLAVGDCLGVPAENESRDFLKKYPITGMVGHGTHRKPAGTWSDDTAFSLATLNALSYPCSMQTIAEEFISCYKKDKYWQEQLFDIGITTVAAIENMNTHLAAGTFSETEEYGIKKVSGNGNGSLMRMVPVALFMHDHKEHYKEFSKRKEFVYHLSSLTHAHIISKAACHIYCEYLLQLLKGLNKKKAYEEMCALFYRNHPEEIETYDDILRRKFHKTRMKNIESNGYVKSTLTASLWCFLNTDSYKDAVLKAVNLGGDTDTTGCVTGGMAGIYYGINEIPREWVDAILKKEILDDCIKRYYMTNDAMSVGQEIAASTYLDVRKRLRNIQNKRKDDVNENL